MGVRTYIGVNLSHNPLFPSPSPTRGEGSSVPDAMPEAFEAVRDTCGEMGLPKTRFPLSCPFEIEEILAQNF